MILAPAYFDIPGMDNLEQQVKLTPWTPLSIPTRWYKIRNRSSLTRDTAWCMHLGDLRPQSQPFRNISTYPVPISLDSRPSQATEYSCPGTFRVYDDATEVFEALIV